MAGKKIFFHCKECNKLFDLQTSHKDKGDNVTFIECPDCKSNNLIVMQKK